MEWTQVAMFWATVGLVLVSVFTAMTSYFLLRGTLDPHVVVYARHDEDRPSIITLVIENLGAGLAHNVRINSDRPIPARAFGLEKADTPGSEIFSSGPVVDGIPVLGPGDRRVITWGQYGGLSSALGGRPIGVRCEFESRRRFPFDPTHHVTESVLEVESFQGTDASSGPQVEVARAAKKIADTFGKLASGWSKLKVEIVAPDEFKVVTLGGADRDNAPERSRT